MLNRHTCFLFYFSCNSVFCLLSTINIACHKNIHGLSVLLNKHNFSILLIYNNHTYSDIIHRKSILIAFLTKRHHVLAFKLLFNKLCTTFKAKSYMVI